MLMLHCSVWLRIVLMVQLIVCTVWELNKERHLTAGLMKAPPKRPQCVHCGFSQSGHLCQLLPHASSYLSVCHGCPFCGIKTAAAPQWRKSLEHHVDLWDWKLEWMWQVQVYYIPQNCDVGQQWGRAGLFRLNASAEGIWTDCVRWENYIYTDVLAYTQV